ncbi:DUF262 domain-containing protein [Mesorhizobium sp. B2-1-3A]|uniref:DUF262 domain-containing protein n=1 Tax=Mesorhizobium sp. B2-1-3A TaxID=2589971 RepID=UPI001125E000|nr:DUF262 domain-containing protein [Mesorhizobium sp. B2-1-3A]TPM94689.1 DUF262 domain-containing protein [Mesorhizobium sp. B2-1-3A]
MARNLTNQDISWFLDMNEKGQLNLNPPYQRRSVWSPRDKRFFIDTILNNYPAPPVFLHKSLNDQGKATYHVVDGKQRIQTFIDFTQNKVRIPDDFSDVNLQGRKWVDLQRETREKFWNYVMIVEMLPDISDAAIRNIFERINRNSRKLTPQELRHAKYDGWLITRAEAEADKKEWRDFGVVTAARIKRMADAQFISELLAIVITDKVHGFDQDMLDDLYADYEDLADQPELIEDDFDQKVEAAKAYIAAMARAADVVTLDPTIIAVLKVQTHFYSLWSLLVLHVDQLPPAAEFAVIYKEFLARVGTFQGQNPEPLPDTPSVLDQAAHAYAANATGASTELPQRQTRLNALVTLIGGQETAAGEN